MRKLCVLTALFALATAANADEEKGLYLGAGIGQFNAQIDDVDDIGPIVEEFDSDDTSFKVFGGWRFGKFFAAELDYIDFGGPDEDVEGVNVQAELNGIAPYLIGTLPLGPVELFAKAGYLFYDVEVEIGDLESSDTSDEDLLAGVGIGITLFDHLHARLEYEYVDISDPFDQTDAFWLSGAWRF